MQHNRNHCSCNHADDGHRHQLVLQHGVPHSRMPSFGHQSAYGYQPIAGQHHISTPYPMNVINDPGAHYRSIPTTPSSSWLSMAHVSDPRYHSQSPSMSSTIPYQSPSSGDSSHHDNPMDWLASQTHHATQFIPTPLNQTWENHSCHMDNSQLFSCPLEQRAMNSDYRLAQGYLQHLVRSDQIQEVTAFPLTPEAFAQYGQVLQAYDDHSAAPNGVRITPVNGGTANKFHNLSFLHSTYPSTLNPITGISIYRCKPLHNVTVDGTTSLDTLKRRPSKDLAFIPMGRGTGEGGITNPADKYLVVVAKNNPYNRPDMDTLRAFEASADQGVVYNAGIWHQPITVLGRPLDLACIEVQTGNGLDTDCESVNLGGSFGEFRLKLF